MCNQKTHREYRVSIPGKKEKKEALVAWDINACLLHSKQHGSLCGVNGVRQSTDKGGRKSKEIHGTVLLHIYHVGLVVDKLNPEILIPTKNRQACSKERLQR